MLISLSIETQWCFMRIFSPRAICCTDLMRCVREAMKKSRRQDIHGTPFEENYAENCACKEKNKQHAQIFLYLTEHNLQFYGAKIMILHEKLYLCAQINKNII